MKRPDWEKAEIDPEKIRDYLLSPTHPVGRFKAPFFESLGYTQDAWHEVQADLREVVCRESAVHVGHNDYGEKYTVSASIKTPSGVFW